jgi:predicted amidohydrolase
MSHSYDPPVLKGPVSAKIRIAACHIDFVFDRVSPVITPTFIRKLEWLNHHFSGLATKPDLIIFPEGCAAAPLIEFAHGWATSGMTTIAGTRLSARKTIEAVVVGPSGEQTLEKHHLSPYDQELGDPIPRRGEMGGLIRINIKDQQGDPFEARVALLICYDFHYFEEWWGRFAEKPHIAAVPMFDTKASGARDAAYQLAKRQDLRSILVNKPTVGIQLDRNRAIPNKWKWATLAGRSPRLFSVLLRLPYIGGKFRLGSSAHGPMNTSDARHLREAPNLDAIPDKLVIWQRQDEAVVVGDYEIGLPANAGHEGADGVGFKYSGLSIVPLRELQT